MYFDPVVQIGTVSIFCGLKPGSVSSRPMNANFVAGDGKVSPPDAQTAAYAVQLRSTGQVLFTDKAVRSGSVVTIYNYYEYNGKKFLYRKATLALDETYFGKIDVSKRTVQ